MLEPRAGIADFNGKPHYSESPFEKTTGDYLDFFLLRPITKETFELVMEAWEIWRRWYIACQTGTTPVETPPALPEDSERYNEIKAILADCLNVNRNRDIKAEGEFKGEYGKIDPKHATNPMAKQLVRLEVIN